MNITFARAAIFIFICILIAMTVQSGSGTVGASAGVVFFLFLGICIYLLPSIVAQKRKVKNSNSIAVINIFLGWTLIGWVVSLAMAFSDNLATKSA